MKRQTYTCKRCENEWLGFAGGLCPRCGGESVSKQRPMKGLGGSTGTNARGTMYLNDEGYDG